MWSRAMFVFRVAAVLFAGVVGVLAVLNYYKVIDLSTKFDPWVWSISLGIIGVDNLGTIISRKIRSSRAERNRKIENALMGLLINLAKTKTLRFEDLGASVYVEARTPWRRGQLKRIRRFRPSGYPLQSGITWTSTTGTVGECWTNHTARHKEWHWIAKRYHDVVLDKVAFSRVSKDTRQGFSCEQFNAIAGKYSEILAVPIWHGRNERRQIGVLTIDRAFVDEDADFTAELGKKDNIDVASATASAVGTILNPTEDKE